LGTRITALPSRILFEISIFPNNVPLPTPRTSAYLIGGTLHFIHFCVRISQIRSIPDSDVGWEDMYREDNNVAWFDWVRRRPPNSAQGCTDFCFSSKFKK